MWTIAEGEKPTAVVVAVQLPGIDEAELTSSMEELERLATTLGLIPVGRVTQRRTALAPGLVLGEGKLKELAAWTGGTGEVLGYQKPGRRNDDEPNDDDEADDRPEVFTNPYDNSAPPLEAFGPPEGVSAAVVLVDHELSPTQQRNLEKATGVDVLDRASVILEIFFRHAKTREARLQVEIARLGYLAPRLRESAGNEDRVRGGVGGKGSGESSLELDRRRIRDRIAELRRELQAISSGAATRRQRRSNLPTVALVGYTNAGKSSLMRALTGSEVYVADKLFATLDTTVRMLAPPTEPQILVTDTVGFIKKLPHDLVASFRSTLDEANEADLLLHVVDAADPAMPSQLEVTRRVLSELGADGAPSLLILNKCDRVSDEDLQQLMLRFPNAVPMSARRPDDVAALRLRLIEQFAGAIEEREYVVPWASHKIVHALHARCEVLTESHTDDGTVLTVRAPKRTLDDIAAALANAGGDAA
ncbi:MAG TPA: GTPase HflX [Kofleriaceae bacterium]|nr:GTPase HflX [Kofleriaceae bacterium]